MAKPIDPHTPGDWQEFVTDGSVRWKGLLKADLTGVGILKVEAGRTAKKLTQAKQAREAKRQEASPDERGRRSVHEVPVRGAYPATVRVLFSAAPFPASAQRRALEDFGVWPAGHRLG